MSPQGARVEAEIEVEAPYETVKVLSMSIQPEVDSSISERSKVILSHTGGSIRIKVIADDTAALRAAINSYLRWVQAIIDIKERISP